MTKFTKLILTAACMALPLSALATDISVSPLRLNFSPTSKYKDVVVSNIGKSTAYVKVTTTKVLNPGTKQSNKVSMKNPATFGLITSPRMLIIKPNQRKVVRVVPTIKNNKQDVVYNVQIMPVERHLMGDKNAKANVVGGIRVIIGYDVGVILNPANANAKISFKHNGNKVTVTNVGNTNAILTDGQQCNASGKACKVLPDHRVYAGNTWKFTTPYTTAFTYKQGIAGKSTKVHVK